jgi:cytoskeletal protein CcmA (bactofilin family)
MRRSNAANSAVVAVAVLSAVCFVALFEYPEDAYAEATYDITFDLNGGSINGQSSFVKTVGELNATGLPDASGSTIPSGKNAFVVWSESPTIYSKLYNAGDTAPPNVTTLYAVWGNYTATSGNVNVTGTGCYIINGATNLSVSVSASSAPLLVLNNSTLSGLTPKNSTNVTILLQNENQIDSMNIQGSNQTIRLSSASTGDVNIVSSSIWGISSFIVDGGNLQTDQISTGGSVILNGGTVNTGGIVQGSSVTINEGTVLSCDNIYTAGALVINGTVSSQGKVQGGSITINESTVLNCEEIYTAGALIINGTASSEEKTQGGSITVNGTLGAGSVYAGGEISINGNVAVTGNIQGSSITVEGGTFVADSTWPAPTITGSAVVVVGDEDIVETGWKYIEIVPGFDTDGITGMSVTFQIATGSEVQETTLLMPKFTDRINLDPSSYLSSDQIEIRYFLNGVEYISVGTAVSVSTPAPGYYTVGMAVGIPANMQYTEILCSGVELKVSE